MSSERLYVSHIRMTDGAMTAYADATFEDALETLSSEFERTFGSRLMSMGLHDSLVSLVEAVEETGLSVPFMLTAYEPSVVELTWTSTTSKHSSLTLKLPQGAYSGFLVQEAGKSLSMRLAIVQHYIVTGNDRFKLLSPS